MVKYDCKYDFYAQLRSVLDWFVDYILNKKKKLILSFGHLSKITITLNLKVIHMIEKPFYTIIKLLNAGTLITQTKQVMWNFKT